MDKEKLLANNEKNMAQFRSSGGRIESFGDKPVLLLTTTGAKTGQSRTSPMMYQADGQDPNAVYVFASAAGSDMNPNWFHNLVAHPDTVVEIGSDKVPAIAEVLPEPQRAEIYATQAEEYPQFADYQTKTKRPIPVVKLQLHR